MMIAPPKRLILKQLGELLLERKVISERQLQKAIITQKEKGGLLGNILVLLGYATEEQIAQVLTTQFGFPYLPLKNYEVDVNIVKLVPENVAVQYNLLVIDKIGNSLTIAMSDPLNIHAIEDVELITNCKVQIFVSTQTNIKESIKRYYGLVSKG
jgi:type IV pilus assembly protein PilB